MTLRRLKTHTAETGYVYQYFFVGKRDALPNDPEAPAAEYIFDASSDRKTTFSVSVFVLERALEAWAKTHRRRLTDAEEYAAAKMRLLRGFDETENMMEHGRRLLVDSATLDELLAPLGVE